MDVSGCIASSSRQTAAGTFRAGAWSQKELHSLAGLNASLAKVKAVGAARKAARVWRARVERSRLSRVERLAASLKYVFVGETDPVDGFSSRRKDYVKGRVDKGKLPYWSAYLVYGFALVYILTCLYLCLLYCLKFERQMVEGWLSSTGMSVGLQVFVFDPLKMCILAVCAAWLIRRVGSRRSRSKDGVSHSKSVFSVEQ